MNVTNYQFNDVLIIVTFLDCCIVTSVVSEFGVNLRGEITVKWLFLSSY